MTVSDWDIGDMGTGMQSNKEERVAFAIVVGRGYGTFATWQLAPKREERWPEEGHRVAKLACTLLSIR
jgi:hypothetical protein